MPESKDVIYYLIYIIGIVVTGIFSSRLLKATQQTNKLTEKALEINEKLAEIDSKRFREMRRHYILKVKEESEVVYKALAQTDANIIYQNLYKTPKDVSVSAEQIAEYLNHDEIDTLHLAWDAYKDYRNKYYSFGDETQLYELLKNNHYVIDKFYMLIEMLKQAK